MNVKTNCPITIITGFLGSGKTTLLGNLLKDEAFNGTAMIVNEFGKAGLDHRLLRRIEEQTILLGGGCVCCNMRSDLVKELKNLLNSDERGEIKLDRVVIETTGLADPAPILFSILTDPVLMHHFFVDFVVATIDAVNGELHLNNNPESMKQVVVADKVVITKTDLSSKETIDNLILRVKTMNPAADIIMASFGQLDPAAIFSPSHTKLGERGSKEKLRNIQENYLMKSDQHVTDIRSIAIKFDRPLDWIAFGLWLSMLLYAHGEKVLRVKGIIDVGESGPVVLNGVQHIIHPPQHLEDWNNEEHNSQIVFIMKIIEPREILNSLQAFQNVIGASPAIQEINMAVRKWK